jgi:hypothetical protein
MNKATDADSVETIATFGTGKLVKTRAGAYRFDGGTRHDQLEALEWAALFFPEGVFAFARQSTHPRR